MPMTPHEVSGSARPYRRPRRKRRIQKNLQKTTRKGAYKKNRKKNMMIRRAPFVETKSKTSEDLLEQGLIQFAPTSFYQSNTPHKHINPEVFFLWKQGLGEAEMIGRSVYAKYLKRKILIRFPQPPFTSAGQDKQIPNVPQDLELIWGWVPMPLNLTGQTTPAVYNNTRDHINAHINKRVVDYFQDRGDYLRFVPKQASTIRITGRRKVRPNMNKFAGMAPMLDSKDDIVGNVPDYQTSIYWTMGRKLHFEKSNDITGTGVEGYFPNYTWLPFCILYNRDWDSLSSEDRVPFAPSVAYNDAIYYSDS